jgi:hypothetical protein
MRESEIGASVMAWLENMGWDCYPEAQFESYGNRADIAAVRDGLLWVVECKTTACLALIEQAVEWIGYTHYNCASTAISALRHWLEVDKGVRVERAGRALRYFLNDSMSTQ